MPSRRSPSEEFLLPDQSAGQPKSFTRREERESSWADDPELLGTFRAEVEERLASLSAGLLQLESHRSPKQLVAQLFRDAHTVKGSARMMGLSRVLEVAHAAEDLLGAIRDGRLGVRRDLVDLLLATVDGIGRSVPGGPAPVPEEHLDALVAALRAALAGDDPVTAPRLPEPVPPPRRAAKTTAESDDLRAMDSVRVTSRRVYDLLDVVGEAELDGRRLESQALEVAGLAAEQDRLLRALREALAGTPLDEEAQLGLGRLVAASDQLQAAGQQLRELVDDSRGRLALVRDGALGLAMVPVRRVVAAFPRLVREVATATGKDVQLSLVGEDVELDKKVLDGVADALKHLVINAVDHGCEPPQERVAAGKPARAGVTVSAKSAGGTVAIEVCDDGRGIDENAVRVTAIKRGLLGADATLAGPQLLQMLFLPAFSTSPTITRTSGRGVGLDVVRTAVEALGGSIEVSSEPGRGTRFCLTLPVTLGVLRCLVARVGAERYAVPVPAVVESISLRDVPVENVAGTPVVVRHGVCVPLLDLGDALGTPGTRHPRAALVVRGATGEALAWAVDRLEGELELVVKDLGSFLRRLPLVAGATIDGDGSVVCLLDLRELAGRRGAGAPAPEAGPGGDEPIPPHPARAPRVLVVEDSVGVRELERVILEGAGYDVVTAVDGLDGMARLRDHPADLVLADVEMPGMDGFALTRSIRRTRGL
jgi:chemotaxis protein histidine kinase CheA